MEYTINSRKLGRKLTFSIPGRNYIFVDINGRPGTLGEQICWGGYSNSGSTIACCPDDDYDKFENLCNRWYRAFLKNEAEYPFYTEKPN